jgi:hypothetical protein
MSCPRPSWSGCCARSGGGAFGDVFYEHLLSRRQPVDVGPPGHSRRQPSQARRCPARRSPSRRPACSAGRPDAAGSPKANNPEPRDIAISHHNLAIYLGKLGGDRAGQRAHLLAAALIRLLSGMAHDLARTVRVLAAELGDDDPAAP